MQRQRGAVAVFAAVSLVALLTAVMLAIEIGRVYSAHHQLQKAATLAALDAARVVSGCTSGATQTKLNNAMNTSLAQNGYPAGTLTTSLAEAGTVQVDVNNLQYLQPGTISNANAARVTLTSPFPTQLMPLFGTGGTMRVSATATQQALGSLRVGSGVAALSGGLVNQLLSGLLGGNVNLTAADYSGLANVNVTAGQLATALGISLTDLSNLATLNKTVVLNQSLSGLTSALSGSVSSTVRSTLQTLASQANNNTVQLGNILGSIGPIGSDVPLVNLGDLINALALASQADASGLKTVEIKNVGLDLPGVAAVKIFTKVLQPPQLSGLGRPGQTKASTAQIKLLIRIEAGELITGVTNAVTGLVNTIGALTGLLGISITSSVLPQLNIGVDVTVAPAVANLNRVDCPRSGVNSGQPVAGLDVTTAVANVAVGTFTGNASAAPNLDTSTTGWTLASININVCPLGICAGKSNNKLSLGLTSVGVSSTTTNLNDVKQFTTIPTSFKRMSPIYRANGAPGTPTVPVASPTTANPQTVGSPTSAAITLTATNDTTGSTGVVGALVSGLLNPVLALISNLVQGLLGLVNGLATTVINPLLSALGLQLGTATTTMDFVTVGSPVIVTTALP